jgi:hypothetical protein
VERVEKEECAGDLISKAHRGWPGEVGQSDFAHGRMPSRRIKESQAIRLGNSAEIQSSAKSATDETQNKLGNEEAVDLRLLERKNLQPKA